MSSRDDPYRTSPSPATLKVPPAPVGEDPYLNSPDNRKVVFPEGKRSSSSDGRTTIKILEGPPGPPGHPGTAGEKGEKGDPGFGDDVRNSILLYDTEDNISQVISTLSDGTEKSTTFSYNVDNTVNSITAVSNGNTRITTFTYGPDGAIVLITTTIT